ncbi:RNA-binding domain-containing protein [Gloeophyllum trabeum ATCC 11539]|uniref:RNA-binding domain-containing protein n=1 Tax=Gloeophyllum trabeum (strain ATCC 11539 / FP-39264 / Madison 617) TaxID=670483 RepID=S7RXF4_GLOTA|nr:RNA-binding domain-containing protein [Gloeophyllum trabeum ATCC 11539]EPQ59595.1 RNA-binding domain-containing protein [Gloeophyllum trabeum ATCC 11539]
MSDAPAAPVTENGVPPATQDKVQEEVPGFKVFAGNLSYSTTDEGLRTFFAPVESEIITAHVILRGTRSKGYGFVSLSTAEAAQKAVELLNQKELDGRAVIVEVAKPAGEKDQEKKEKKRRVGRRGSKAPRGEVTDAEANGETTEKAEGSPGETTDAAKPKKKKKVNRKKRAAKKAAAAADGEATSGAEGAAPAEGEAVKKQPKPKKVRTPRPRRAPGEEPTGEPSKNMLFVANLGFNVGDDELANLFKEAGINVLSARIIRKRRKSQGYGFVDVGNEDEQKKAIEALNGKEVGGRAIAVKVAVNSPPPQETEGEQSENAPTADAPAVEAATAGDATPEATVIAS